MIRVFRDFRDLVGALNRISASLVNLVIIQEELGPAEARLEELELSRRKFEAEMTGLLEQAEGKLKASNNSEARARTMLKHYEKESDPLDPDGEEVGETFPDGYAPGSEADEVQPLRMDVAPDNKTLALNRKFGLG